jgi:hypothetical protein
MSKITHHTLINKLAGFLSAGLILAGLLTPAVFAQGNQNSQSGFNFSTSPTVLNIDTKPGNSVTNKVQLKNNGTATEHVRVKLLKFTSDNVGGSPILTTPEANDEVVNWITFSESTFDAEPNVWKTINVTVAPPASAAFGYYYAVSFTRDIQDQNNNAPANLTGTVAVPMLINVEAPGTIRKADITGFSVSKNVYEFLPAKFSVTLKNSGNTHVAPRGNIFVTKGGKNIATLDVNAGKGNILPTTARTFNADWNEGSPVYKVKMGSDGQPVLDKKGQPVYTLNWGNFDQGKLRFGKYHAKVVMVYNDGHGDVSTQAELNFWVVPWRIIGFMVIILLLVVLGLWTLSKPLRRRIRKQPSDKKHTYKAEG